VFYGISKMRLRFVYAMIVLIISINAYGLIVKRQHYNLFYHQGYQAAVQSLLKFPNINLFANGNSAFYFQYYFNKYHITPTIQTMRFDSLSYGELSDLLSKSNSDTIAIICGMPTDPEYFILAQNFFPNVIKEEYGAAFHSLILSRSVGRKIPIVKQLETREIEPEMEYINETTLSISNHTNGDILEVSAFIDFYKDTTANPLLVLIAEDESHKQLYWKAASTNEYKMKGQTSAKISIAIRIDDVINIPHPKFKAFIWNKDKQYFKTTAPNLQVNKGNPSLYGIISDF